MMQTMARRVDAFATELECFFKDGLISSNSKYHEIPLETGTTERPWSLRKQDLMSLSVCVDL